MNNKPTSKYIYAMALMVLLWVVTTVPLAAITVTPTGTKYVGDRLVFLPSSTAFSSAYNTTWNFGDGTTTHVTSGLSSVIHSYKLPGVFTVTVVGQFSAVPSITETLAVVIEPRPDTRSLRVSPMPPVVGQVATFTAFNFITPTTLRWDMGDGTIKSTSQNQGMKGVLGASVVTHTYSQAGTFQVRAYDFNGLSTIAISLTITIAQPNRQIGYSPRSPRVDQPVSFQALNFITPTIDWNFGDGTILTGSVATQSHRYAVAGTYTVSARDATLQHTPVTAQVTVLPENRFITVTPPEARINQDITVTANQFRGQLILWDFGDGLQLSGGRTVVHQYRRAGVYTISARDENGASQVRITAQVTIQGINDEVNLQIAEVTFDNGKYYKVIPKNSKHIQAVLRMKMRGTGLISGYWVVDGHPYEFFNEVVRQGEVKEIYTRAIPGLPVIDAGLHTVTVQLTRPADIPVTFPVLKYFVLPYENLLEVLTPNDGFIAKEDIIPQFSWAEPKGASKYQVAFSNYLYPLLGNEASVIWHDVGTLRTFTPGADTWQGITRNEWTYWRVRALDTFGNVVAESEVQDIKVVIATAKISIHKVTDLNGNTLALEDESRVSTRADDVLVQGSIQYMGDSDFLVLRVYVDEQLTDQLLFRDIKKEEIRYFETSIANQKPQSKVQFQVLKVSSPAVMVGIKGLLLNR